MEIRRDQIGVFPSDYGFRAIMALDPSPRIEKPE